MALLSADTDMATDGWAALTSVLLNEIVIAELNADEFGALLQSKTGKSAYLKFEQRVNNQLRRSDLKHVWIEGIEKKVTASRLFPDPPPTIQYRDILVQGSSANEVSRTTADKFEAAGGRVIVINT